MKRPALIAAAVLASTSAAAMASERLEWTTGEPIIAPFDSQVCVEFVTGDAIANTRLNWLGHDPDPIDLGDEVFSAVTNVPGDVEMLGNYQEGEAVWFASVYDFLPGLEVAYRQDDEQFGGSEHFRWMWLDEDTVRLEIENDAVPQFGDYQDMVVNLDFKPVPTPGAGGLLALAGLVGASRRRR